MESADKKIEKKDRKISVMNWIGTMILCSIPGVNILSLLCFAIFSKAQAKRSFAVAFLILMIFAAAIICAAFLIFPDQLSKLASDLRGTIPQMTAGSTIVLE